jgi:hypothetical protein
MKGMTQRPDVERYRENWHDEVDSAAQYRAMAASEPDPKIAKVEARNKSMWPSFIMVVCHSRHNGGVP